MNIVFIALLCLPVVEIAVLISVGGAIGLPLTILFVLLTAIVGTFLLRQQGLSLLFSAQQQVAQGQLPAQTMAEGIVVAVGGALLLTPGFVTDALGFMCLIPVTRHTMVALLKKGFVAKGGVYVSTQQSSPQSGINRGETIDGDFKREE